MRKTLICGTIALLSACSEHAATPAQPAAPPPKASAQAENTLPVSTALSAAGVAGIRFGMTLAQAEQAAGAKASLPTPLDLACSMVRFPTLPKLRFMVEQGVVTRADAEAGVENALGLALGDTLAQVRAAHPEAQFTAHKYDQQGQYGTFPSADGRAAVILEASGGKVTKIRAGLQPAVAYVETCG